MEIEPIVISPSELKGAGRTCPWGHVVAGSNLRIRGKRSVCIACYDRIAAESRARTKQEALDGYGGKCNCCGIDKPVFLTIDHVNDDGKDHRRPSGSRITGVQFYRQIIRAGWPAEFQVLCWNCNAAKAIMGGCPDGAH